MAHRISVKQPDFSSLWKMSYIWWQVNASESLGNPDQSDIHPPPQQKKNKKEKERKRKKKKNLTLLTVHIQCLDFYQAESWYDDKQSTSVAHLHLPNFQMCHTFVWFCGSISKLQMQKALPFLKIAKFLVQTKNRCRHCKMWTS